MPKEEGVRALFAVLVALFWVSGLYAQAPRSGLPFFKRAVTKDELLIHVRDNCSQNLFNVTCEEFLTAIQDTDSRAPESVAGLASYLETLEEGRCGVGEARFSVIYTNPRSIQYNERRLFASEEMCLFSSSNNLTPMSVGSEAVVQKMIVLSLECGNTIPVVYWLRPWDSTDESLRQADAEIRDTAKVMVPRGTAIVGRQERMVIYEEQHITTPHPMIWRFTPVDTTRAVVPVVPMIPDTVFVKKRRSWLPYAIGGAVVGGVIGYIIKKCKASDGGGPVNPPNRIVAERGFVFSLSLLR